MGFGGRRGAPRDSQFLKQIAHMKADGGRGQPQSLRDLNVLGDPYGKVPLVMKGGELVRNRL